MTKSTFELSSFGSCVENRMEENKSRSREARLVATAIIQGKYEGGFDQSGKCRGAKKLLDSGCFEDRADRTSEMD